MTDEAADRDRLTASTSASIHFMFDEHRMPTIRVDPGHDRAKRVSLRIQVAPVGFPGHDADVVLTGHREDLLALLDQARAAVLDHRAESPAEQAEAEAAASASRRSP